MTAKADMVRWHAAQTDLRGIEFIDPVGRAGARGRNVHTVRLTFIDGAEYNLTRAEFAALRDVQFTLRPMVDDA